MHVDPLQTQLHRIIPLFRNAAYYSSSTHAINHTLALSHFHLFTNVVLLIVHAGVLVLGSAATDATRQGIRHIQHRIDHLRDRLDLSAQLLLDAVQIVTIVVGN